MVFLNIMVDLSWARAINYLFVYVNNMVSSNICWINVWVLSSDKNSSDLPLSCQFFIYLLFLCLEGIKAFSSDHSFRPSFFCECCHVQVKIQWNSNTFLLLKKQNSLRLNFLWWVLFSMSYQTWPAVLPVQSIVKGSFKLKLETLYGRLSFCLKLCFPTLWLPHLTVHLRLLCTMVATWFRLQLCKHCSWTTIEAWEHFQNYQTLYFWEIYFPKEWLKVPFHSLNSCINLLLALG